MRFLVALLGLCGLLAVASGAADSNLVRPLTARQNDGQWTPGATFSTLALQPPAWTAPPPPTIAPTPTNEVSTQAPDKGKTGWVTFAAIFGSMAGLSLLGICFFCYKRRKLCFGWRRGSKQRLGSGYSQRDREGVEMTTLERGGVLSAEERPWIGEVVNPGAWPIDYQRHWDGGR